MMPITFKSFFALLALLKSSISREFKAEIIEAATKAAEKTKNPYDDWAVKALRELIQ